MKKIIQTFLFLFSITTFACSCKEPNITEKYIESDLVAKVKIIKNYKNVDSREIYKADIIINELYKGQSLKSIYISGRSDGNMGSSCSLFIPENTELIIYASKDKEGKYIIGMCSGLFYLNKGEIKKQNRELEILNILKTKNISYTNRINNADQETLYKILKQFKDIELNKEYGIYEVIFNSDLKTTNIQQISGFGNTIDTELIQILANIKWTSLYNGINSNGSQNNKLLIGIYYYKSEKGYSSFLSSY